MKKTEKQLTETEKKLILFLISHRQPFKGVVWDWATLRKQNGEILPEDFYLTVAEAKSIVLSFWQQKKDLRNYEASAFLNYKESTYTQYKYNSRLIVPDYKMEIVAVDLKFLYFGFKIDTLKSQTLHERLCEWRESFGETRQRMANYLGLDNTALARMEHGEKPLPEWLSLFLIGRGELWRHSFEPISRTVVLMPWHGKDLGRVRYDRHGLKR